MTRIFPFLTLLFAAGIPARGAAEDTPNAKAVKELVKKTGEDSAAEGIDDVFEVRLGRDTNDGHLKALADLAPPKLWKINLGTTTSFSAEGKKQTKFTRAGLKELTRLPALRDLRLPDTCVDDDVKEIAGCKGLEVLFLTLSKVTDAGLAHLAAAPKLREVNLNRTATTDAGWEPLSKVRTLEKITAGERVTGRGVEKLAALPKLKELDLSHAKLTDAGAAGIGKLKTLRSLDLSSTPVTDAGLKELAGLTELKQLRLGGTKVTAAGVEALKKALPDCRVEK